MKKTIELELSDEDQEVGYLFLPKHPRNSASGIVKKTIAMSDLLKEYKGVPIYFDFDQEGELIGIEIVG